MSMRWWLKLRVGSGTERVKTFVDCRSESDVGWSSQCNWCPTCLNVDQCRVSDSNITPKQLARDCVERKRHTYDCVASDPIARVMLLDAASRMPR